MTQLSLTHRLEIKKTIQFLLKKSYIISVLNMAEVHFG